MGSTERWRRVSQELKSAIAAGDFAPGERLPASTRLAEQFGVHQHTVLRAIAHLQDGGLLRIEQGRGTFVVENSVSFRIGRQTWFEANLSEQGQTPSRRVLAVERMHATATVANKLELQDGASVIRAVLLGEADGVPIYVGRHHFPEARFPALADFLEDLRARQATRLIFSDFLRTFGVRDLQRSDVRIRSRQAEIEEARLLKMSPTVPVTETRIVLLDEADQPIVYGVSAYCAERVELVVDL